MAPATEQASVLVYDRIAHNHRVTALLIGVAALSVVLPVAVVSIAIAVVAGPLTRCPVEVQCALGVGTALVMLCILGLLLWSMASEPMSKLLAMLGGRLPTKKEREGKRLLENLAIGAGLPVPRFYVIDSLSPNACAAGMDPSNSAVAVTVGLLELLDNRELEGVLAHELSHIGNRDTRLNTLVAAIALFLRIPYLLHQQHQEEDQGVKLPGLHNFNWAMPLLLPARWYLFFIAPTVAALIRSAVSRSREFLADADAALLTSNPEGLMRALAKIGGAGSILTEAHPLLAHLYFAGPSGLGADAGPLADRLLDTHPPIAERIALLAKFEEGISRLEIAAAVKAGEVFAQAHPIHRATVLASPAQTELSIFTAGNPPGRAFRLVGSTAPVPVYDRADRTSRVVAYVMSGDLLVVFDDPGKMREILTQNQIFGYLPARARLQRVDILPAEVFDAESRVDALRRLTEKEGG